MADRATSAMAGLAAGVRATTFTVEAMAEFQAACARGDWPAAEAARVKILAATESYLAEIMSAFRAMRDGDGDGV